MSEKENFLEEYQNMLHRKNAALQEYREMGYDEIDLAYELKECHEKLSAYEHLGFSPEELKELLPFFKEKEERLNAREIELERREAAVAEKEGKSDAQKKPEKTGAWIWTYSGDYKCPFCSRVVIAGLYNSISDSESHCPGCGARLKGTQTNHRCCGE